jgi:hypothetical protein
VVIAANGRMRYDPAAVAWVSERPGLSTPKNEPAGAGTRLAWLGHIIPIPGLATMAMLLYMIGAPLDQGG